VDILRAYKYCPRCGNEFNKNDDNLSCKNCGLTFYNNAKPTASIVLYNDRREYLFGIRAIEPKKGYLDTIGGFLDGSETFEECALRETKEELGLDINLKDLKYLGSFAGTYLYQGIDYLTINVVFTAKLLEDSQLKPSDDVLSYSFLKIQEISTKKLAFAWIGDMLKVLSAKEKSF